MVSPEEAGAVVSPEGTLPPLEESALPLDEPVPPAELEDAALPLDGPVPSAELSPAELGVGGAEPLLSPAALVLPAAVL